MFVIERALATYNKFKNGKSLKLHKLHKCQVLIVINTDSRTLNAVRAQRQTQANTSAQLNAMLVPKVTEIIIFAAAAAVAAVDDVVPMALFKQFSVVQLYDYTRASAFLFQSLPSSCFFPPFASLLFIRIVFTIL